MTTNMNSPLNFTSEDGILKLNGKRFYLRGLNWFGCESSIYVLHGLWCRKMEDLLDWIKKNNFNAIRVPFPVDFALNPDKFQLKDPTTGNSTVDLTQNPDLKGLTCGQVLDRFIKAAADRGLLIMFSLHHMYGGGPITETWKDATYTEDVIIKAWKNMISRYNQWNVFALDIKNEPHGAATWGDNNPDTDWAAWFERCANELLKVNPNLLMFCEGIDNYVDKNKNIYSYPCWGGALQWVNNRPIKLSNPKKLVYSPHQYGPNISKGQGCVGEQCLENNFGFIKNLNSQAVVPGEWGGDCCDYDWQQAFADYLNKKDITDNFHWCINPNSGDTKGMLEDDWKTDVTAKLKFCQQVCPNPTVINVKDGKPSVAGVSPKDNKPNSSDNKTDFCGKFLDLYKKIHDSKNGYFSREGIPYHAVETVVVEAPDMGHESVSETVSYWIWLEAMYGKVTGDWQPLQKAWDTMEKYFIPSDDLQTNNSDYNPNSPATYMPEGDKCEDYPVSADPSVPVGQDPIANDLKNKFGSTVYGMHWLVDVDNWYGFGKSGPQYFNNYQRGPQESCFLTIPQPSIEDFSHGGPNGFLDLFGKSDSYAKQARFTIAPDADGRVISSIAWAKRWADAQGGSDIVDGLVNKAAKMGSWLQYCLFDKYFKPIGCQDKSIGGGGYDACHYLLSWYYSHGYPIQKNNWAFKIGCSHNHFGYQNPFTAYALSTDDAFKSGLCNNAANNWSKSVKRQVQFYAWLQSAEGPFAGGATNSLNGRYEKYPPNTATFFGMAYQESPVFENPPSNLWCGWQTWGMERLIHYYYASKDKIVLPILQKWVGWWLKNIKWSPKVEIPTGISWSGQPESFSDANGMPKENVNLHCKITDWGQDCGVMPSLARCLLYYAQVTGDQSSKDVAKKLIDAISTFSDEIGYSIPEVRSDYKHLNDTVYVPPGFHGVMPDGSKIESGATFSSLRTNYQKDPMFDDIQSKLKSNTEIKYKFHRFWSETEVALAFAVADETFNTTPSQPAQPPKPTPQPTPKPQPSPNPPQSQPSSGGISVSLKETNSWKEGNISKYQFDITLTNTTSQIINTVKVSKLPSLKQFWNLIDCDSYMTLPQWKAELKPNESFNWGGIFSEASPKINIL